MPLNNSSKGKIIKCLFLFIAVFLIKNTVDAETVGKQSVKIEQFITTGDNVKLFVKVSGAGPAILFVHGGPGQGSLSFRKMGGSSLENFATMICLDQRGSSKSQNAANYHLDRVVEDIEEVRKSLGFEKIYLLAHSFGGIIAVNYARKYPDHVSGLILAAATLYMNNSAAIYDQIKYANQLLKRKTKIRETANQKDLLAAQIEARSELSKQHLGYKFLTDKIKTIEKMNGIDESYPRTIDFGTNVIKNPETFSEYYADYTKITPLVHVPVLILTGRNDHAVGAAHYRSFRFPDQTIKHIVGGHLFYYENNKVFVKTVSDFIKRNRQRHISRRRE